MENEGEIEEGELIHLSYSDLADGNKRRRKAKEINPEIEEAIKKALGMSQEWGSSKNQK